MHEQCYKEFSKDFQNCAICSKPLHIRRGNYGKNFSMSTLSKANCRSQRFIIPSQHNKCLVQFYRRTNGRSNPNSNPAI
jgi:hypothetical protein